MLGQRRRRWPVIETSLGERLVFAGAEYIWCLFKQQDLKVFYLRLDKCEQLSPTLKLCVAAARQGFNRVEMYFLL